MKSQIADKQNSENSQSQSPCLRALEGSADVRISVPAMIWEKTCEILSRLGRALRAQDDIETWRRLEFRNEYQERRNPNRLDMHRWF